MRPLATAQGSRRRATVSTGAVKSGMIGVLATATIAAPLATAYADGSGQPEALAAPQAAAPAIAPASEAAPVALPAVETPSEVRPDNEAASRSEERGDAPTGDAAEGADDAPEAGSVAAAAAPLSATAPAPVEPAAADGSTDMTVTAGVVRPVPGPITSGYGSRVHPVLGYTKMHDGVDFGAACGTPVKAAKAGTVVAVEYHPASGNRVKVDHGNGQITGYYHLQGFNVTKGQQVNAGDVVGFVGSTGRSTGCHLHFALMDEAGTYSNPMSILQ